MAKIVGRGVDFNDSYFNIDGNGKLTLSTAAAAAVNGVGAANGSASLDGSGKVPISQLPAAAIASFLGSVASQVAMLALSGEAGDWCVRSDQNKTYILIAADPTQLGNWQLMLTPTDNVLSVNGETGAVTLTGEDIGVTSASFAATNVKAALEEAVAEAAAAQSTADDAATAAASAATTATTAAATADTAAASAATAATSAAAAVTTANSAASTATSAASSASSAVSTANSALSAANSAQTAASAAQTAAAAAEASAAAASDTADATQASLDDLSSTTTALQTSVSDLTDSAATAGTNITTVSQNGFKLEVKTLSGAQVAAKRVALAATPTDTTNALVTVRGIGAQFPTADFAFVTVDGTSYIDWNNGEGMAALNLADGDKIAIQYKFTVSFVV